MRVVVFCPKSDTDLLLTRGIIGSLDETAVESLPTERFHGCSLKCISGVLHNMSIYTIYTLSSHYMGALGFAEMDIVEVEVPESEVTILHTPVMGTEVYFERIKKEWVVSYLRFEDYVTEPVHHENALLYSNHVLRNDTYRMCYSPSVVFNGHGHGDCVECMRSSELLADVEDVSIQRDYVQEGLWKLFVKYVYAIKHGLKMNDIHTISYKTAHEMLPEKVDPALIVGFNMCKDSLIKDNEVVIFDTNLEYNERLAYVN